MRVDGRRDCRAHPPGVLGDGVSLLQRPEFGPVVLHQLSFASRQVPVLCVIAIRSQLDTLKSCPHALHAFVIGEVCKGIDVLFVSTFQINNFRG